MEHFGNANTAERRLDLPEAFSRGSTPDSKHPVCFPGFRAGARTSRCDSCCRLVEKLLWKLHLVNGRDAIMLYAGIVEPVENNRRGGSEDLACKALALQCIRPQTIPRPE
jgi:hypothetical protein